MLGCVVLIGIAKIDNQNGAQGDVRQVDVALVAAGVKCAFGVAGSAVTANPLGLIQVTRGQSDWLVYMQTVCGQ